MKNAVVLVVLLFGLAVIPATAGVVFSDLPYNGTEAPSLDLAINPSFAITDTFTATATGTVYAVNFGLLLLPGDLLSTVDWEIGTTDPSSGHIVAFGTGLVSIVLDPDIINPTGLDFYVAMFRVPDVDLLEGTGYYLKLGNATVTGNDLAFWDENDAPGVTATNLSGPLDGGNSFELLSTPEPSSLALLGAGILAALALRRKAVRR